MFRPAPFDFSDFDITEHEGKLWAVFIYADPKENNATRADLHALASSEDGVHWEYDGAGDRNCTRLYGCTFLIEHN